MPPCRRNPGRPGATTKPQLAIGQLRRLKAAGLPAWWTAADEAYGRSSEFREACQECGLAYVVIILCGYFITTPACTTVPGGSGRRGRGLSSGTRAAPGPNALGSATGR